MLNYPNKPTAHPSNNTSFIETSIFKLNCMEKDENFPSHYIFIRE